MTARLLNVTRKGKVCHLLTSMTDAMRYPGNGRPVQPSLGN
jgi:putative transposase